MTQPTVSPTPYPPTRPQAAMPQPIPQAAGQAMSRPQPVPVPIGGQPQPQAAPPMPSQMPPMPGAPAQQGHAPLGQAAPGQPHPGQPLGAPQMAPAQAPMTAAPSPQPSMGLPSGAMPMTDPTPEGGEKALPSVTIHAFCERQETAGVINQSTRDWRMRRTNVKIYMGGLSAAIEFYRKENTPALIVIESGMRGAELFSQLEELAGVCDENTRVVVIGAANDIRLYRQLMEQGVSDYLVPPFTPLAFIRSIADLYQDPETPFMGRSVAFYGTKGGVGSSTLAHNVAWQLAETLHSDTALVDLDASFGTTALDFHYDASAGLEEALAEPDRLDEVLLDRIMMRHTPRLSILPASGNLGKLGSAAEDTEAFQTVVDAVRGVSPLVLLDMPHVWAPWTEAVLTAADDVIVTATLDLASLRNTKNILDFLKSARPNDPDPILVVNMVGLSGPISVEEFGTAVGLQPSVSFAFNPDVFVTAANEGEMITDMKSAAGTVEGFQRLASRIRTGDWPVEEPTRSGARGLLKSAGLKSKGGKSDGGDKGSSSFIKGLLSKAKKDG